MELPPMVDYEDLPRWFALSTRIFPGKRVALVIMVSPESIEATRCFFGKDLPMASHYFSEFRFKRYEPDVWRGFGFNGAMLPARANHGQVEIVVPLVTNRTRSARAISASLSLLLIPYASFGEARATQSNRVQLMTLEPHVSNSTSWGATVGGLASPSLRAWLRANHANTNVHERILRTMRQAYCSLGGTMRTALWDCRSNITPDGRFLLGCPGDGCDVAIYPDGVHLGEEHGARISCHNLDHPIQQLTLLAGLAKMHELADRDLTGPSS